MCARAAGRPRPPPIPRRWREGERERGAREKVNVRAHPPPAGRDQRPFASPLPVGGGRGLAFGTEKPPLGRTRPPGPPPPHTCPSPHPCISFTIVQFIPCFIHTYFRLDVFPPLSAAHLFHIGPGHILVSLRLRVKQIRRAPLRSVCFH